MVEVGKRFRAIGLGRLDQAVGGGAGLRSTRGIGKEPVPASDRKGTDGVSARALLIFSRPSAR